MLLCDTLRWKSPHKFRDRKIMEKFGRSWILGVKGLMLLIFPYSNRHFPANIYLYIANNRNTRRKYEICSKLTIKTPERRRLYFPVFGQNRRFCQNTGKYGWRRSDVFYCQLWTYFTPFSKVSIADFEQVNVSWVTT